MLRVVRKSLEVSGYASQKKEWVYATCDEKKQVWIGMVEFEIEQLIRRKEGEFQARYKNTRVERRSEEALKYAPIKLPEAALVGSDKSCDSSQTMKAPQQKPPTQYKRKRGVKAHDRKCAKIDDE